MGKEANLFSHCAQLPIVAPFFFIVNMYFSPFALSLWLSYSDITQIMELCIDAPESYRYDIFNATSDNQWKIFSIEKIKNKLGYKPKDRALSEYTPREYNRNT